MDGFDNPINFELVWEFSKSLQYISIANDNISEDYLSDESEVESFYD